ncbi:SoxR reducing system RseC family protein [Chitinivorax sp. B]|uniref:SoxR reducing system RseC family protein n=1 Tax=Chitinivorax sp. B TaxID=2502235 RepID=UPI0010F69567|nr:SoxR reducing system RseC family protein [Chitinivorax sp. B]
MEMRVVVCKVAAGSAQVEAVGFGRCGQCQGQCSSQAAFTHLFRRAPRHLAISANNCQPGDMLTLGVDAGVLRRVAAAAYGTPLLSLMLGALLGALIGEQVSILGASVGLLLGILLGGRLARRIRLAVDFSQPQSVDCSASSSLIKQR